MLNAVIVHGWGANASSNWFPWLQEELEKKGVSVTVPNFPSTQQPQLRTWLKFFRNNVTVNSQTILIGHSLGVPFILHYLDKLEKGKICKASFLVAGFERSLGILEIDNFVAHPFNWQKIRQSCQEFCVINSDNDPYIPLEIGQELAAKLGVALIVEHLGEHLNAPGGYLAYPKLRDLILTIGSK